MKALFAWIYFGRFLKVIGINSIGCQISVREVSHLLLETKVVKDDFTLNHGQNCLTLHIPTIKRGVAA